MTITPTKKRRRTQAEMAAADAEAEAARLAATPPPVQRTSRKRATISQSQIESHWRRAHESLVWAREARPDLRRRKDIYAYIKAAGWYDTGRNRPNFRSWDRYLRHYFGTMAAKK